MAGDARAEKLAADSEILDQIIIIGDPGVFAGAKLTVEGVRVGVDGLWDITKVTHVIDNNGYQTDIQSNRNAALGGGAGIPGYQPLGGGPAVDIPGGEGDVGGDVGGEGGEGE